MEEKKIKKIVKEYDLYLNTLKHVSCLNLNNDQIRSSANNIESNSIESYLQLGINEAHERVINRILKNMLDRGLVLDDLKDIHHFVVYPDFKVLTHIDNPANLFKNTSSLEKTVLIVPCYELNLELHDSQDTSSYTPVLCIKRLVLGPSASVISQTYDKVNSSRLEQGTNRLALEFRKKIKSQPTKDDLLRLKSLVIKYLRESVKGSPESIDFFKGDMIYCSYDYIKTKMNICRRYKVNYKDQYASRSEDKTPWLFDGLSYYDNRKMEGKVEKKLVPLAFQRERSR